MKNTRMIKKINQLFGKQYKMTKAQKKLLAEQRRLFKKGKITIEEAHEEWKNHPDYIKQYGYKGDKKMETLRSKYLRNPDSVWTIDGINTEFNRKYIIRNLKTSEKIYFDTLQEANKKLKEIIYKENGKEVQINLSEGKIK